jgi:trans-2,3-dihydro-3-hydroxyanthranilate isomerase
MPHRLFIVDVFAAQPYAGNPLAVVLADDGAFSDATMQQVAAEMNLSETTFVAPAPDATGSHRVRLFSPAREIAFGGHPILGTAWVLRHRADLQAGSDQPVRLRLQVGVVPVHFETHAAHAAIDGTGDAPGEVAWFVAPPRVLGARIAADAIARALGLAAADIDTALGPVQQVSSGTSACIVPLRSLDALRRARLDLSAFAPLVAQGLAPLVYLFCRETRTPGHDLSARFFFEAHGVREDPATGNGAAFLGEYLLEHGGLGRGELSLRIGQGHEVQRPSLVRVRARTVNGTREVQVGGGVVAAVEGQLL